MVPPQQATYFASPSPGYGHPPFQRPAFPQQQAVQVGIPVPGAQAMLITAGSQQDPSCQVSNGAMGFPQNSCMGFGQFPNGNNAPQWNNQFCRSPSPTKMGAVAAYLSGFDLRHGNNHNSNNPPGFGSRHGNNSGNNFSTGGTTHGPSDARHNNVAVGIVLHPQSQTQTQPNLHHVKLQQGSRQHPNPNPNQKVHPNPNQMPFQGMPQQHPAYYHASAQPQNAFQSSYQGCNMGGTAIGVPVGGTPPKLFSNHQHWQHSYPDAVSPREVISQGNQAGSNGILESSMPVLGHAVPGFSGQIGHPDGKLCMEGCSPRTVDPKHGNGFYKEGRNVHSRRDLSLASDDKKFISPAGNQAPYAYKHNDSRPFEKTEADINGSQESQSYRRRDRTDIEMNGYHPNRRRDDGRGHEYEANGRRELPPYRSREFRASNFNRGRGERPYGQRSDQSQPRSDPCSKIHQRCDPCDRDFASSTDLHAHMSSHVKCDEEGCTFEASGKIIKEHKVVEHGKTTAANSAMARRARALKCTEDKEEVERWREERKRNYPTNANVLRKADEKKKREAQGIFIDEELQKRRQRMREVLSKQKRIGFQALDIPRHYLYDRPPKRSFSREVGVENEHKKEETAKTEEGANTELKKVGSDQKAFNATTDPLLQPDNGFEDGEVMCSSKEENGTHDNTNSSSLRQVHFSKSSDREFQPRQKRRKQEYKSESSKGRRQPTLLSKLLERDIQKENSYLQQCCRFIIANSFLQIGSAADLRHFNWVEADAMSTEGRDTTALSDPVKNVLIDDSEEEPDSVIKLENPEIKNVSQGQFGNPETNIDEGALTNDENVG